LPGYGYYLKILANADGRVYPCMVKSLAILLPGSRIDPGDSRSQDSETQKLADVAAIMAMSG